MSETKEQQPAYISRVHLKGYKSIRDLEIDFKAGLNIIIGPNGSGKTNFLEFILKSLDREYLELNGNFKFSFNFENISVSKWTVESVFKRGNNDEKNYILESSLQNNKEEKLKLLYPKNINSQISNHFKSLNSYEELNKIRPFCKINYSVPQNIPLLDTPYSIYEPNQLFKFPQFSSFGNFIDSRLSMIASTLWNTIADVIPGFFELDNSILNSIRNFSPIKDVRLSQGFYFHTDHQYQFTLDYLSFEFLVNNMWLSWKQLSDGTKRLFYLIHEIAYFKQGVFFVDEPELGIHPDQLYLLMDFLKEQSKTKQIIITTHSPEVLNILEKNELDRIIVTRYDAEKGTQMHHLSPKKIKKGQMYMDKVGYLSTFWVHSNLEEYEAEEYEVE